MTTAPLKTLDAEPDAIMPEIGRRAREQHLPLHGPHLEIEAERPDQHVLCF
jgi:hypothetical protein